MLVCLLFLYVTGLHKGLYEIRMLVFYLYCILYATEWRNVSDFGVVPACFNSVFYLEGLIIFCSEKGFVAYFIDAYYCIHCNISVPAPPLCYSTLLGHGSTLSTPRETWSKSVHLKKNNNCSFYRCPLFGNQLEHISRLWYLDFTSTWNNCLPWTDSVHYMKIWKWSKPPIFPCVKNVDMW